MFVCPYFDRFSCKGFNFYPKNMSLFTLCLAPILSILKKFVQGSSIKKLTHWNSGRAYVCQIRFHNSGSSWRKSPLFTTFSKKSKAGREEEAGSGDLHTSALQRVALEPLCPHFAESSRCCSSQFFSAIIALYSVQFWQPNQAHTCAYSNNLIIKHQRLLLLKVTEKIAQNFVVHSV